MKQIVQLIFIVIMGSFVYHFLTPEKLEFDGALCHCDLERDVLITETNEQYKLERGDCVRLLQTERELHLKPFVYVLEITQGKVTSIELK